MLVTVVVGIATFVWIRFIRFPPLIRAYNVQVAAGALDEPGALPPAGGDDPTPQDAAAPPPLTRVARGGDRPLRSRAIAGPGGPTGSHGVADQVLWSDDRAHVSELAFSRRAFLPPQTSPQVALFVVVSGGGWVQVGDERVAINHGEAVTWPAGVSHGAWTDGSEMRALLVELAEDGLEGPRLGPVMIVEGSAASAPVEVARGQLARRTGTPEEHDPTEGEPW